MTGNNFSLGQLEQWNGGLLLNLLKFIKCTALNHEEDRQGAGQEFNTWFGVGHSKHIGVFDCEVLSIFQALLGVSNWRYQNPAVPNVLSGGHDGCSGANLRTGSTCPGGLFRRLLQPVFGCKVNLQRLLVPSHLGHTPLRLPWNHDVAAAS